MKQLIFLQSLKSFIEIGHFKERNFFMICYFLKVYTPCTELGPTLGLGSYLEYSLQLELGLWG